MSYNFPNALIVISILSGYLDGPGLQLRCVQKINAYGRQMAAFHYEFMRSGIQLGHYDKFHLNDVQTDAELAGLGKLVGNELQSDVVSVKPHVEIAF